MGWLDKAAHAFRQWPHVAQLPELQLPQLLLPSLMLLLPGELKPLITRPGPCLPQCGQLTLAPVSPIWHNLSKRSSQPAHLNS